MKQFKYTLGVCAAISALTITSYAGADRINSQGTIALASYSDESTQGSSNKKTAIELDDGEKTHLIFMREEEKLAHDVYTTLGEAYPDTTVFANIVLSEETHTGIIADKLDQYGIDDPSTTTEVGEFTGEDYGWYFTEKYNVLVNMGLEGLLEALYVGALIEELDMYDIVACPKVIVSTDNDIDEGECGMEYTDEKSLVTTYSSLLEGSKDHLRAYVGNIEAIIGEGNYTAQYLSQDEVDDILGR
jgi:hypothetical protein